MVDIRVEPPEDPPPDTVTFRRGDGGGLGRWLRDHPRLRALRARRPPSSVVAAVSAVIAGVAVATYMDRPVEVVEAPPSQVRVVVPPESWLNVQVDDVHRPEPSGEEQDRMLARHPPEATVALSLFPYEQHLFGLPPGAYHVQASCSAADPEWFVVEIVDPGTYQPFPEPPVDRDQDPVCDGDLYTISARMEVTGYQAVGVSYYSAHDQEGAEAPGNVTVVASFTPVS